MGEISKKNQETLYKFRFGTSEETVELTQQELDHFPYLSALIIHKDDFVSIQNENNEYILDSQIRFTWFMPIYRSIITAHPSALLTELPREANLWGMLQLYDYLCINPLPIPLLKDQYLIRLNTDDIPNRKMRIEYIRAENLLVVRDTAVQFIIVVSKNEYDLDDCDTLYSIYSLIMNILSSPKIFGLCICHHLWKITKKHCFSHFSYKQQRQLHIVEESLQNIKMKSLIYLYSDTEPLPDHFDNVFAWQGVHIPIEENINDDCYSNFNEDKIHDQHDILSSWSDINLSIELLGSQPFIFPRARLLYYPESYSGQLCRVSYT